MALIYIWPSDDEQLAGQAVDSHFDEDASWWAGAQKCGATVTLAAVLAITTASTALATSVFGQREDTPQLLSTPLVYEEYWQNPVAPVNWPQPAVKIDDDVHPTFVQVFTPDDGDWRPLVAPVADSNYIRLPFLDPDLLPQFSPINPITDDAESVWQPQIQPWDPNWTLLFFLDDGSTVPIFQYDEDFWANPVAPYNWPQPAQPFQAADDDQYVQTFLGNDEAVWTPQVASVPDSLRLQQQWPFDQNELANLVSFTNEDYWQNPVAPVPDSIWLLRQDAFEQTDATGALFLDLDEGLWANPVRPIPDSLVYPQQWAFDEFESTGGLRTTIDEDFWINPVQPIVWYGQPLPIFDEVIETFVPTFQPDEDLWQQLVAPVVAQNIYNQPYALLGHQEDDTPVLAPFVPPPVVPCLPPGGADGDISINYFGGNKNPTQVLLCRICNSGKPLLVRGDYAIWCQDCCAFVSKQDTVMMTVSAPGQFKAIF